MVTEGNYAFRGEHFVMCKNVVSLYCTLEMNTGLIILQLKKEAVYGYFFLFVNFPI